MARAPVESFWHSEVAGIISGSLVEHKTRREFGGGESDLLLKRFFLTLRLGWIPRKTTFVAPTFRSFTR